MDHVAGPFHILLAKKEGGIWFNIICLNLPIWENYLVVFVSSGICPEICPAEIILKNLGLPKFASNPPLGGRPDENFGRPWNLTYSPPCRTPCRLFIHEVLFGPSGLHLCVWSVNLVGLRPFDQRELLDCNGHGPSVLCVKWPLSPKMVHHEWATT